MTINNDLGQTVTVFDGETVAGVGGTATSMVVGVGCGVTVGGRQPGFGDSVGGG